MANSGINQRLAALRDLMAGKSLEALMVAGSENRRYLSGFTARDELLTETCGWLLITPRAAFLLTDFRYRDWAAQAAPDSNQDNKPAPVFDSTRHQLVRQMASPSRYVVRSDS